MSKVINESKVNDDLDAKNESKSENKIITLEDIKKALEEDVTVKGYIDSLVDTSVNKRLEKRLTKELQKAEEERLIKEEEEAKAKEEEAKIKDYEKRIAILENTIKYKKLLEESGLSTDLIDFLSNGTESEKEVLNNIARFKDLLAKEVAKEVKKRVTENPPIPKSSEGSYKKGSFWSR